MRIFDSIITIVITAVVSVSAFSQDELNNIRKILTSREEAFKSQRILLHTSSSNTANCVVGSKICGDFISIIKNKYPSMSHVIGGLSSREKQLKNKYSITTFFGIDYADQDSWIIHKYGEKNDYNPSQPQCTSVMKNCEWTHYTPPDPKSKAIPNRGIALINKDFVGLVSPSVLFGFGLGANNIFEPGERSKAKHYYSWNDLFRLNDKGTIQLNSVEITNYEGVKRKCKMLQITTEVSKHQPIGYYRYEIFLDIEKAFCPIKAIAYASVTDIKNVPPYRNVEYILHWTNVRLHESGLYLPDGVQYVIYQPFPKIEENKSYEEWKTITLDVESTVVKISSIKPDDGIQQGSIQPKAPPGTHVVNQLTGYTYVVGSAGEAIDEAAIAVRTELGIASRKSSDIGWKGLVLIMSCLGLLLLLAYGVHRYFFKHRAVT